MLIHFLENYALFTNEEEKCPSSQCRPLDKLVAN